MTTIKDPVRQASLFTPFGLIDPRLMPDYVEEQGVYKNIDQQKGGSVFMRFILNLFKSKISLQ